MLDKSQIGVICRSPRATRETQDTSIRKAGAQWIVKIGKLVDTWRELVGAVREGDTVFIYALALIPTKRGDDELPPSAQASEFIMEVHERGGTVVEVTTGRNSRDRSQRRAMVKDALKAIRRGSRQPPTTRGRGRPQKEFTAKELAQAERAWKSKDYVTNDAAVRHFPEGFTAKRAWALWGPSGRTGKAKRKR